MARIDLLFGFTYQRRYELACTRCEHGWVLDTETMDQQLGGCRSRGGTASACR